MNEDMEAFVDEPVKKILDNFKMGLKEGELAAKLSRYRELSTEIELLEEAKDRLRKELIEAGKGEESISAGDYAAFFKKVKGRESFDWKQFSLDNVGKPTEKDNEKYLKIGEESIRMEVKKIR